MHKKLTSRKVSCVSRGLPKFKNTSLKEAYALIFWHRWQQMVAAGYLKVQVHEHEQRLNPNTEFKHMMKHPVRDFF